MTPNRNKDLNKYWEKTRTEIQQAYDNDFQTLQKELYHDCLVAGYSALEMQAFSSRCFELALKLNEAESRPLIDNIARKIWFNLLNTVDVNELLDSTKLTPKQKSLVSLYYYLNLVEGGSTTCIQFIAFMLIKNGKKLCTAKKYEDLKRINLKSKIKFLSDNSLNLAVEHIDRNLRNCIAHQDFIIFDDGVVVNLETGEQINIQEKVRSLNRNNSLVLLVLKQAFDLISPTTDKSINTFPLFRKP